VQSALAKGQVLQTDALIVSREQKSENPITIFLICQMDFIGTWEMPPDLPLCESDCSIVSTTKPRTPHLPFSSPHSDARVAREYGVTKI
jgi:hypothetical protein